MTGESTYAGQLSYDAEFGLYRLAADRQSYSLVVVDETIRTGLAARIGQSVTLNGVIAGPASAEQIDLQITAVCPDR